MTTNCPAVDTGAMEGTPDNVHSVPLISLKSSSEVIKLLFEFTGVELVPTKDPVTCAALHVVWLEPPPPLGLVVGDGDPDTGGAVGLIVGNA